MRPVSPAKEAENTERIRVTMPLVRKRDHNACVGGRWTNPATCKPYLPERCYGETHGHEIITRAQGGSITDPGNVLLLCDGHNRWATEHTDEAVALGFRQLRYDPYSSNVAERLPHLSATAPSPAYAKTAETTVATPDDAGASVTRAVAVLPVMYVADPLEWSRQEDISFWGWVS